jgi:outer membrane lipopolysaccharide assembly protein LptE/RlpB
MRTVLLHCLLIAAALLPVGCGYGLIGRTSNLPEDIDSIFVETLENRTTRQQINLFLTQAIVDEFVTRRRYDVVASAATADAILSGALTAYIVRPVEFGPDGRATRYEFTIRADMELTRQGGEEVLWSQDQYVYRGDFELQLDEGQGTVIDNEDPTIQLVSREFAQTLVINMLEGF